ncbi:hypothetical protein B0H12DRAFT_1276751, partial [Mycena haematopus]
VSVGTITDICFPEVPKLTIAALWFTPTAREHFRRRGIDAGSARSLDTQLRFAAAVQEDRSRGQQALWNG